MLLDWMARTGEQPYFVILLLIFECLVIFADRHWQTNTEGLREEMEYEEPYLPLLSGRGSAFDGGISLRPASRLALETSRQSLPQVSRIRKK